MTIAATAASVWRDKTVDGLPVSSPNQPQKSDIRSLFSQIDAAISAFGITGAVTVVYATYGALAADLVHADGVLALVWNDATAANNGIYVKSGASGTGEWSNTALTIPANIYAQISQLASAYIDLDANLTAAANAAATAQVAQATSSTAAATAVAAADQAAQYAQAAGISKVYSTKAEANADLANVAANAFVMVIADESLGGKRSIYHKESGAYVLKYQESDQFIAPESFGAVGDGAVNDRAAMLAAQAASDAAGQPLILRGKYNVGTTDAFYTATSVFQGQGEGVEINGFVLVDPRSRNVGDLISVNFNNGTITRLEQMSGRYAKPFADKALWLGQGDQDTPQLKRIEPSAIIQCINNFPGSDDWTEGTYAFAGPNGLGFSLATASQWQAATVAVLGGMEVCASIGGSGMLRGVVVVCSSGAFVFYAPDSGGPGTWYFKATGVAVTTANHDYAGRATHASWYGQNSDWTVRIYDYRTIGVVINGVEVFRYQIPSGFVMRAGFCAMASGTTTGADMEYFTVVRRKAAIGGQMVKLAIYGDSKSCPYYGGWDDALREALDGSAGVRVTAVNNYAVTGEGSGAQLAVMTATPPTGMTDTVIHVGTNDVQGTATAETSFSNISSMIDLAYAAGSRVHIVVPDLWYPQSLVSGYGENTLYYDQAARTRAAILNLAAQRGCYVVELHKVSGPVLADWHNSPDISDPRVRDNIHPTNYYYRVIGMEIARSVLRGAAPQMTPELELTEIPAACLANGWTASTDAPGFTIGKDGTVHLYGKLSAGTTTNGTVVCTLPENLRPQVSVLAPIPASTGIGRMSISASNGQMSILDVSGVSFIALDGISFKPKTPFN